MGVMLFSLGGSFWRRQLDLAQCLETVASLGPDQGVDFIGAQGLRTYPDVDDDEVRRFRSAVDRTGVIPVSYCAYLERARSRSRVLSPLDAIDLVEAEVGVARRLGFPMLRLNTAPPEVVPALARLSDRTGTAIVVELATEPRTDPAAAELISALDRVQCAGLGLLQDFSAFVEALPAPFAADAVADGTPPRAMVAIAAAWRARYPLSSTLGELAEMPGLTDPERSQAIQTAHIAFALFRGGTPDGLRDVLPHLRHVHAKFFAADADGAEPCVPYPEVIGILREGGYAGRLHSEFEGFLWSDDVDPVDQIARQQRYLRRLWGKPPSAADAAGRWATPAA